jgi:DNA-binding transcriptional LysR family regulator
MTTLDWNALQFVLALARHRSLERAAEELDVDPSTVSRRVHALEQEVGARVFDRTTSGHRLTVVGQRLLQTAERVEADIAAMERDAERADQRLEGLVRIATSDAFGRHRLSPIICGVRRRHPLVDFEVVADTRSASVVQREVDLAVRFVRPEQVQLVSRRLATLGHGLYAARSYLATRPLAPGATLEGHDLLGFTPALSGMPEARWLEERSSGARFVLRANRLDLILPAALAGFGLAVLPCYLGDREPDLVRLRGPDEVVARDLWLVLHRDSRRTGRIRAFVDHCTAEVEAQADALAGAGPGSRLERLA